VLDLGNSETNIIVPLPLTAEKHKKENQKCHFQMMKLATT